MSLNNNSHNNDKNNIENDNKSSDTNSSDENLIIPYELSNEQKNIINSGNNIIVDAVAGSGKTTTILHLTKMYPKSLIVQITYNNMLKQEVRKRANELEINNMIIHTYHSVAVNYYCKTAYTDEGIKKILLYDTKLSLTYVAQIDILIIDEIQDMSVDYFNLVKKLIKDTKSNPKIFLFGDKNQTIYEYKGANSKFITMTDQIWNKKFEVLPLSESFRVTKQNAWFINNVMLKSNRIKSNKEGLKIDYYVANPQKVYKYIGKTIMKMIRHDNIKPDDIFVLSPSIKSLNSPFIKLENYLVKQKIKCITPSSENSYLDNKLISGKVVFTTYHQAKGRERKVVIIYNFDNSLFDYYLKNEDETKCPNIIYVGVTRASEKLILVQDCKNKQLPFINLQCSNIKKYVNFIQTDNINLNRKQLENEKISNFSVTDLVKFISPSVMDYIIVNCDGLFECIRKENEIISINSKIQIKKSFEDVSDLNGIVIPALYEKKYFNEYSFLEIAIIEHKNSPNYKYIKKYVSKINIPCVSLHDNLVASNIYLSIQSNLHAKLNQITKYDWLTKTIVNKCHKNMKIINSKQTKFEIPVSYIYTYKTNKISINGRIDVIDDVNVYELKCVDFLTIEHKLQLIIYEYLCRKSDEENNTILNSNKKFKLLNIRTGEILQFNKNNENNKIIDNLFDLIIENKLNSDKKLNDTEFIDMLNNNKN
jgi:hypothetical protein